MNIPVYQADAFTDTLFGGNPAAICILEEWLPNETLQAIAAENNLAETAFIIKADGGYDIRWFTPAVEVDLCGHATLAAAHVLFATGLHKGNKVLFYAYRSGELPVTRSGSLLTLDFPVDSYKPIVPSELLLHALGADPQEAYIGRSDIMVVFSTEEEIVELVPDFKLMSSVAARGIIATAPGNRSDFVCRFFAPQSGVNEDPVTGSAHTTLVPYWADKLGRNDLTSFQLSERGGKLTCKLLGDRVAISGHAVLYMRGEILLNE